MKNQDVIEAFVARGRDCKTTHLFKEGNTLRNYGTIIAKWEYDYDKHQPLFYVDSNKYSQTTSVIQNKLRREIHMSGYEYVEVDGL